MRHWECPECQCPALSKLAFGPLWACASAGCFATFRKKTIQTLMSSKQVTIKEPCACGNAECKVNKQEDLPTFAEIMKEVVPVEEASNKCECGMAAIGGGWHSTYCPKYEEFKPE